MFLVLGLLLFSSCSNNITVFPGLFDEKKALVTTTDAVYNLHKGNYYTVSSTFQLNTLDNAIFLGCTGDRQVHMTHYDVVSDEPPYLIEFSNNVSYNTSTGSSLPAYNMNRGYIDNSSMTLLANPQIFSTSEILFTSGALGTSSSKTSAPFESVAGLVLDSNECYMFNITNNGGNNNDFIVNFYFYEE